MQSAATLRGNPDLPPAYGTVATAFDNMQIDSTISFPDSTLHKHANLFIRCEAARQAAELAKLQSGTTSGLSAKWKISHKAKSAKLPPSLPLSNHAFELNTPHERISDEVENSDSNVQALVPSSNPPSGTSTESVDLNLSIHSSSTKTPPQTLKELIQTKTAEAAPIIRALQRRAQKHLQAGAFSGGSAPPAEALEAAVKAMAIESIAGNPWLYRDSVFKEACERGSAPLQARAASLRSVIAARNAAVSAVHAEAKKAWKAARVKAQRERLEALKSDDLEGYMRLVQTAKSTHIDRLLSQTDACLRQLAGRLRINTKAVTPPPAAGKSPQSNNQEQGGEDGGGFSALQQSSEAWNTLAAAFNADIATQPEMLTGGELREYQMRGLRWMVSLRDNGLNGILADEMGLGKTVQVIALVAHCLATSSSGSSSGGGGAPMDPFLIAAPASVLPNWEKEFARWAPDIKVVSYRGPAADREEIFRKEMRRVKGGGTSGGQLRYKFHVALTSYEYLMGKIDRPRLAGISWSYIIVDEGHRLKNSGCKLNGELAHYRAAHRLLLTGTPLQNGIEELWSLLNFLMPDLFSSAEDFNTWFGGAMRKGGSSGVNGGNNVTTPKGNSRSNDGSDSDSDDDDEASHNAMLSEEEVLIVTSRLHQVLRPFMLRRLKEAVAGELPAKVEHLVPCRPAPYQQALFSAVKGQLQGPGGVRGVSNALMEMRNICNHPLISRLHVSGVESSLLQHPLPAEVRLCGKMEILDRILLKLKATGHRVLIFCTMTRLLDVLEDYLHWRGLGYLRLDGSTGAADRGALVEEFNAPNSPAFAFLLSVRAGGVGLNLQAADTVIFYDTDWNPQMDAQAAARAHRIGQTKDVLVLRLQTVGTVEERVTAVAADKRGMADRSITGGFFDGKTSAAERQKYLLSLLRAQPDEGGGGGGAGGREGAGDLTNAQLNRLLARGDHELEVFEREDARLAAAEQEAWKKTCMDTSMAVESLEGPTRVSRLASAEEVAPLMAAVLEALAPPDPDAGKEFGRGKRARGDTSYMVK